MFKNFNRFVQMLEEALKGEATAIKLYTRMAERAPGPLDREFLSHIRDDEKKHFRLFSQVYLRLTGKHYEVGEIELPKACGYPEELTKALIDELEAAEMYREMMLATCDMCIREIMFIAMTDEMEHATRLTYLFAKAK